ncbi:fumarylacetoacetate hydrolase family protein [Leisingera sp.]|uniref:fumarylacetoacetate hydrolase family protein n=1 Tax=Leisingera sp. TaxID=1879318 RepID=UPI003A94778A
MPGYVIEPPRRPVLAVAGEERLFSVRRVYCIGRNYAGHALEMGHDPDREPPFFFQKNPDNLNTSGKFRYPDRSSDVHFEAELAVALGGGGRNILVPDALRLVYGYAPALDMTRRDLQAVAKKMGRPWEVGKAFEGSAPIGPIEPVSKVGHIMAGRIRLDVNGETRQQGDLNQMIWKVPEIISYLSEYFELAAGDIILTGTPAGVGPTVKGDALRLEIEGLGVLEVDVV